MKVVALQLGYDNVALREPGVEFELPDELVLQGGPAWFEPVEAADKTKFEAARKAYRKPEVSAVDPGKQTADYLASIKALQEEIEALKKAAKK